MAGTTSERGRTGDEQYADERDAYVGAERDRETDTTGTGKGRADAPAGDASLPRNPGANFGTVDLGRTDLSSDTGAGGMHDDVGATGTESHDRDPGRRGQ
jgi:hypothetical protein